MNFVISMTKAAKRRKHITNQFSEVSFSFFNAVVPDDIDSVHQQLDINISRSYLTQGEIACMLSHISLWHFMIEKNLPYITIFEDDIHLGKKATLFLSDYRWVPTACHLIKLEAMKKSRPMKKKKLELPNGRKLGIIKERHLGAAGYILSNHAAKKLLAYLKNTNIDDKIPPLDYLLFDYEYVNQFLPNEPIYQLLPALCVQDDRLHDFSKKCRVKQLNSQLEQERVERQQNNSIFFSNQGNKLSMLKKVKRELSAPYHETCNRIKWR